MSWGYRKRPTAAKQRSLDARYAQQVASFAGLSGRTPQPVRVTHHRAIATTFWGKAWCKNLEAYSDYENRLPRGRTYARNGSILHLEIDQGSVKAMVRGTSLYQIVLHIEPVPEAQWRSIRAECGGQIDSLVELLQGKLSAGVMAVVTRPGQGLFPTPSQILLSCNCPDWATMCKHVAATLYGVGARLDEQPELLFRLRGVDPAELVPGAIDRGLAFSKSARGVVLAADHLAEIFGADIDFDAEPLPTVASAPRPAPTSAPFEGPQPNDLSEAARKLLAYIQANPGLRRADLAPRLGMTGVVVGYGIDELKDHELIEYEGSPYLGRFRATQT